MCHAKYNQKLSMAKGSGHGELIPLVLVTAVFRVGYMLRLRMQLRTENSYYGYLMLFLYGMG
jgi:hypothetical protein